MQAVLSAWRRGDAARLADLLAREYRAFPALYRPLVTQRNQRWLPQIEQLLHGERNCLVIVGALHLVGEGGLLELLRDRKSTRLNSSHSQISYAVFCLKKKKTRP